MKALYKIQFNTAGFGWIDSDINYQPKHIESGYFRSKKLANALARRMQKI